MKPPFLSFVVLSSVCVAALVGCAGTTRITAQHDPLYRAETHLSTITATASNGQNRIAAIRIDAIIGEMTACTEGIFFPSVIPCRINAASISLGCTFPNNPTTATCSMGQMLGDRRLVTYTATATTGNGRQSTSQPITYAGGASLAQFAITPPGGPPVTLPWDVARPVWWHTGSPHGANAQDRINVGFFPDADFANYRAFTDALQPMIIGAHFNETDQFAQNYSFWRGIFDLWAGPPGADASEGPATGPICTFAFGGFASNVASVTDGEVILHTANFRDCASITLGGTGTVHTGASPSTAFRYMHESGHFLQGLGDEYCCNGGYFSASTPRNIDTSKANCESTASSIGVAQSLCGEIGTSGKWRIDEGNHEIMVDDGDLGSDWRDAAGRAVGNRANACADGNCF